MRLFHRAGLLYGSIIASLTGSMLYFTCFCNNLLIQVTITMSEPADSQNIGSVEVLL